MVSLLLASFGEIMNTVLYIAIALLVLMLMITIHELGHYLFGKWLGFKIEEFAIGFGKAIFKKKLKNGETFSIRLIPLGGYCAFKGEDKDIKDPDDFNSQKPWKRIIVQLGGVVFNFISAIIFAFILLVSFGYDIPQLKTVDDRYANSAIIKKGDVIREVDGVRISFVDDTTFAGLISSYEIGENITLTITRDGKEMKVVVQKYADLDDAENTAGVLGITSQAYKYNFIEALVWCIPIAAAMAWKVLAALWMLITGAIGLSAMGGPITTITTIADYSAQNIANLFVFLPFIAANLAVFNLLPIPALDGSRIIFTTIEWIRRKPIKRNVEAIIHFIGLVILFGFVIFIDIFHLFS